MVSPTPIPGGVFTRAIPSPTAKKLAMTKQDITMNKNVFIFTSHLLVVDLGLCLGCGTEIGIPAPVVREFIHEARGNRIVGHSDGMSHLAGDRMFQNLRACV